MPTAPTLEAIAAALDRLTERVDALDGKVGALDRKVDAIDGKVGSLDARVESLEGKVDELTGGGRLSLRFLAEQQRRILDEMREMKDDLRVSTAMVQRLDGTVTGLLNEVRAEHARFDRLDKRLKRLEPEPLV